MACCGCDAANHSTIGHRGVGGLQRARQQSLGLALIQGAAVRSPCSGHLICCVCPCPRRRWARHRACSRGAPPLSGRHERWRSRSERTQPQPLRCRALQAARRSARQRVQHPGIQPQRPLESSACPEACPCCPSPRCCPRPHPPPPQWRVLLRRRCSWIAPRGASPRGSASA
jgi:hypothetical protein